jgi:hypothetical protein
VFKPGMIVGNAQPLLFLVTHESITCYPAAMANHRFEGERIRRPQ